MSAHAASQHWLPRYVGRRLLQLPLLLLAVLTLDFAIIQLAPGDPMAMYLGSGGATPEYLAALREKLGLDASLPEQYWQYVSHAFQLDLGYSQRFQEDVLPLIVDRIPATLLVAGTGLLVANVVGIVLGVEAARRRGSSTDRLATVFAVTAVATPPFWLGQLLLLGFGFALGWFPIEGMRSSRDPHDGLAGMLDTLHHLVLPAATFAAVYLAFMFRLSRTKMIEALNADFTTLARAKGLSERQVVYRHALRSASLSLVTLAGYNFGLVLASSVVIERVYSWPGLGQLMFDAIAARDFPTLLGLFTVVAAMVLVVALITDVVYRVLDPRVAR